MVGVHNVFQDAQPKAGSNACGIGFLCGYLIERLENLLLEFGGYAAAVVGYFYGECAVGGIVGHVERNLAAHVLARVVKHVAHHLVECLGVNVGFEFCGVAA